MKLTDVVTHAEGDPVVCELKLVFKDDDGALHDFNCELQAGNTVPSIIAVLEGMIAMLHVSTDIDSVNEDISDALVSKEVIEAILEKVMFGRETRDEQLVKQMIGDRVAESLR